MSILDEVAAHADARPNNCTVNAWLIANPEYTTAELAEAAEAHSRAAVHRFMKAKGFAFGVGTVETHLNGSCKCH